MSAELKGIEQLFNRILIIETAAKDLEPAFKASGVYMLGSIERNFQAQGRPQKWQALAPSTLAQRRKGRGQGGAQILIDTARLKNSHSTATSSDSLTVGTNLVYAARQHFGYPGGSGRGRSKTPARPFLLFQDEDVDAIETIFNRHLSLS